MDAKVNYKDKTIWNDELAPVIANDLGYVLNARFIAAYQEFVTRVVRPATVTDYLKVTAEGHFKRVQPPLQRTR